MGIFISTELPLSMFKTNKTGMERIKRNDTGTKPQLEKVREMVETPE